MFLFLSERDPFANDTLLQSIATGVVAECTVHVDRAKEIGNMILAKIINKNPVDLIFKKKDQAVAQSPQSIEKIHGESIQVDPQLLFQRLVAAAGEMFVDQPIIINCEFCSFHSAIFDS